MFNVQTINCMQYSEPVVDRNHAMKEIRTGNTLFKKQQFSLIEKKLFGPQGRKKKTRKQERKANRIFTLDVENSKKVEL